MTISSNMTIPYKKDTSAKTEEKQKIKQEMTGLLLFELILLCHHLFSEIKISFYFQSDMISFFPSGQEDSLLYTPNSTFNDKLIECLRHKLEIIEESKLLARNISVN